MRYYCEDKIFKFDVNELTNIDGVYYYLIPNSGFRIRIDNVDTEEGYTLVGNRFKRVLNDLIEDPEGFYVLEYEESVGYNIVPKNHKNRIFEITTMFSSYGERWALYMI